MGDCDFDGFWGGFYLEESVLDFEGDLVWMDLDLDLEFSVRVFS